MKPMLQTPSDDLVAKRARELLAAYGPMSDDDLRLQRLRRAIDLMPSRRRRATRSTVLLAALVLMVGAASAAITSGQWSRTAGARVDPSDKRAPTVVPAGTSPRPIPVVPARVVPAASTEPAPPSPTPAVVSSARAPTPRGAGSPPPRADASAVALVHEAARALRGEGDPERAARLLAAVPVSDSGPLAEEALALRIEAALAKHDPAAAAYGRLYLARYPHGRYRALASRALATKSQ